MQQTGRRTVGAFASRSREKSIRKGNGDRLRRRESSGPASRRSVACSPKPSTTYESVGDLGLAWATVG